MDDEKFIGQRDTRFRVHAKSHSTDDDRIENELIKVAHHHMRYLRSDREKHSPSMREETTIPRSSEPNIYTFMQALDTYLCQRFKYRKGPCRKAISQSISVNRSALSLHLNYPPNRYEHLLTKPFVIAKMECGEPGKGNGTDFLRFLASQAKDHQFQTIVLESIFTENFNRFAVARGFRKDPTIPGNWLVAVDDLQLPST